MTSKKKRSSLKFRPIFCPKLGEEQKKKGLHSKFGLIFPPNSGAGLKQTNKNIPFVITSYSPNCFGQETAKGPFGLRVKLPPAHLSTTHGGGFTLSLLMLNVKQESCEYQFLESLV